MYTHNICAKKKIPRAIIWLFGTSMWERNKKIYKSSNFQFV